MGMYLWINQIIISHMTKIDILMILGIFLVCELFIIGIGSVLNYLIYRWLVLLMDFVEGDLTLFYGYLILLVIIITGIRIIVPNLKDLLKMIMSILAFLSILFYLYVRFIVKKLPQNLPSSEYPEFSIFLYSFLTILYIILLIIIPIYLSLKTPKQEPSKWGERLLKAITIINTPFIWMYEYIPRIVTNWASTLLDIGVFLFKYRHNYKIIATIIYVLPRLICGIALIVEILYSKRIYYFYYIIWLTFIPLCFHYYLLMLQTESNRLLEYFFKLALGRLVKIDPLPLNTIVTMDIEQALVRGEMIINPESTEEDVKGMNTAYAGCMNLLTELGKADIVMSIYYKSLRETNLKYIILISNWLYLIGWSLALTICILNYPV